jgi:hypothetical protein
MPNNETTSSELIPAEGTATPESSSSQPKFLDQIFPGVGIGLLVGFLVGLSISPVVSGLLKE